MYHIWRLCKRQVLLLLRWIMLTQKIVPPVPTWVVGGHPLRHRNDPVHSRRHRWRRHPHPHDRIVFLLPVQGSLGYFKCDHSVELVDQVPLLLEAAQPHQARSDCGGLRTGHRHDACYARRLPSRNLTCAEYIPVAAHLDWTNAATHIPNVGGLQEGKRNFCKRNTRIRLKGRKCLENCGILLRLVIANGLIKIIDLRIYWVITPRRDNGH